MVYRAGHASGCWMALATSSDAALLYLADRDDARRALVTGTVD
jgi:hypothetical protein